jgi:uncharacterized protein YcbK (DUF882 family)
MPFYIYIYAACACHFYYFLKEEEEEEEEEEKRKKVQNVSKLFKICHKRGPNKAKNTRIDPKCPLLVRRLEVQFCHQ